MCLDTHVYELSPDGKVVLEAQTQVLRLPFERTPTMPLAYKRNAASTLQLADSASRMDIAEFQWRLSMPLTTVLMGILGFPLSQTEARQGKYAKLFAAVLVYGACYKPACRRQELGRTGHCRDGTGHLVGPCRAGGCPRGIDVAAGWGAELAIPMKLLDRHIGYRVIRGYVLVMAILLAAFSILVLVEELDQIGKCDYTLPKACLFALLTLPSRTVALAPITALLGSLIALGELPAAGNSWACRLPGCRSCALGARSLASAGKRILAGAIIGMAFHFDGQIIGHLAVTYSLNPVLATMTLPAAVIGIAL